MKCVLRNEIAYYKKILGCKDVRLNHRNKTASEINENFIQFLSHSATTRQSQFASQASVPVLQNESESDYETDSEPVKSESVCLLLDFQFKKQGTWVAVAYDDGLMIGHVINVFNGKLGTVQYMSQICNKTFRWPQTDIVYDMRAMFIFHSDFDVISKGKAVPSEAPVSRG